MATPKQTDPQFKLRLPQALKDQIDMAASESNRSLNAEIVLRLEDSFEGGIAAMINDSAFFRGMQIALVETILAEDDPMQALFDLRERLLKPMDVDRYRRRADK